MNGEDHAEYHTENVWNSVLEKSAQDIGNNSIAYKWMHLHEARKYSSRYNMLMYATIILGPLAGILSGLNIQQDIQLSEIIMDATIALIGFSSGAIAGVVKWAKYDEQSNMHKNSAAKYTSLAGNIRRQMMLLRLRLLSVLLWVRTRWRDSSLRVCDRIVTLYWNNRWHSSYRPQILL